VSDYTAKPISEMDTFYKGLFRRARAEVGASSFGLAVIELAPNAENHPDHDHPGGQEEVYVVLSGTGQLDVGGDTIDLGPETIVRVGPDITRRIRPGDEGMRLLAIGGTPGQAYQPPAYTEVGAPDPLDG